MATTINQYKAKGLQKGKPAQDNKLPGDKLNNTTTPVSNYDHHSAPADQESSNNGKGPAGENL